MNYRQWKKSYKKRHGYNPPLEADKRQQAKALKKAMRNTNTTINHNGSSTEYGRRNNKGYCRDIQRLKQRV